MRLLGGLGRRDYHIRGLVEVSRRTSRQEHPGSNHIWALLIVQVFRGWVV